MTGAVNPLVSIILTTLNSEEHLADSIVSCLSQTQQNVELIVVDGGSTDRTLDIVASYDDPRIRVIHQEQNTGHLPGAINLGMAAARGDYITWTQDDCWYEPNAIEEMVAFLANNSEVGLVYTDYWVEDMFDARTLYFRVRPPEFVMEDDVVQVCFLFRRAVYEVVGPQDVRYHPVHEIPWRIKVARQCGITPLHRPLFHYRLRAGSLTGRLGGHLLQRQVAQAVFDEGHIDRRALARWQARIDVDEAYDLLVRRGDYSAFRRLSLAGVRKDPSWLRNRGLLKQWVLSLLPGQRERQRNAYATAWRAEQERQQAELLLGAPRVNR